MSAPILAVDADGRGVWAAYSPEVSRALRAIIQTTIRHRGLGWDVLRTDVLVCRGATRARTACAVAHEHARRLA